MKDFNILDLNHKGGLTKDDKKKINRMSINDFINLDPNVSNYMNTQLLRAVVNKMSMYANKNLEKADKADISSPGLYHAQKRMKEKGRAYGGDGLNLAKLRSEFRAVKNFLDNDTRTISGAEKFNKDLMKRLSTMPTGETYKNGKPVMKTMNNVPKKLTKDEMNAMWDLYYKYSELNGNYFGSLGSANIQRMIFKVSVDSKFDENKVLNRMQRITKLVYELNQSNDKKDEDGYEDAIDNPFDIG